LAFKLGELGHGPRQLSFFNGGRIEEFVPCRHHTAKDLEEMKILQQIAVKVAIYHNMDKFVPTVNKPRDVFETIRKHTKNWSLEWLKGILREKGIENIIDSKILEKFTFETEMNWLSQYRQKVKSPLVHAHYDLNSGNILIREKPDIHGSSVMLVDYEGACMERRGFDFGGFFNFYLFSGFPEAKNYPSVEYRRFFLASYLEEWKKEHKLDSEIDTIEHMLLESEIDGLLHTLFLLSMWIAPGEYFLSNEHVLKVLLSLSQVLMKNYFERKEQLLQVLN
jgi:thiamine kinase-like enzyme